MSSTVSCIWRSKDLAWASCLFNNAQLESALDLAKATLPINVLTISYIINNDDLLFQFKKHAIAPRAQTILILEPLNFFMSPDKSARDCSILRPIRRRA